MDETPIQPVETTKVTTASATIGILLTIIAGGGSVGAVQINDLKTQVDTLESEKRMVIAEMDSQKALKESATDAYLYAMISSNRKPAIDVVPLNDLGQAYINVVGASDLSIQELFQKGKELAKERGDYVCPQ